MVDFLTIKFGMFIMVSLRRNNVNKETNKWAKQKDYYVTTMKLLLRRHEGKVGKKLGGLSRFFLL